MKLATAAFDRLRRLSPRFVLAAGFAVFLIYAFPGYMSTDSTAQLVEARTLVFSDAHPPLMAVQWALLDRIISGPLLMLLLQGALFLGGLYGIFLRLLSPRTAAWTAAVVFVFPPVMTCMAVIWKDSQMAAYLIAGTAAMLHPRVRIRVLGLGLFVIACALRHNAFAAVAPLVFFLFEWRQGINWWKRVAMMFGAAVIVVLLAFGLGRLLAVNHVKLTPVYPDIVGVMARTDDKSDEEWRYILRGTPLVHRTDIQARARKLHEMGGAWRIVASEHKLFNNARWPEEWDALSRVWNELVLGDPVAYLHAHWDTFAVVLGLRTGVLHTEPVWNLFLEERGTSTEVHQLSEWSRVQWWLGLAFNWLDDHTVIFVPYVYAILALVLLALFARDRLTIGLLISALLYELSYFPASANPDYRYSHWMITSVVIATVILFIKRRGQREP
jgi:hypothetical protein